MSFTKKVIEREIQRIENDIKTLDSAKKQRQDDIFYIDKEVKEHLDRKQDLIENLNTLKN